MKIKDINNLLIALITLMFLSACGGSSNTSDVSVPPPPPPSNPPPTSSDPCDGCFNVNGYNNYTYVVFTDMMDRGYIGETIYVTGSANVSWEALEAVGEMIDTMLMYRPDIVDTLRSYGAFYSVFARNETQCDIPYFEDWHHLPNYCLGGGAAGFKDNPTAMCSERNALGLSNDLFNRGKDHGENVCLHEMAHLVMNVGMSDSDVNEIHIRYEEVMNGDLWTKANGSPTYARENADEFWAELTQVYFNANYSIDFHTHNGINGSDQLKEYDPKSFSLINNTYIHPADLQ